MIKKKKNKWEDHYARQAKKEKYPARSVFKLKELEEKFTIIKKNDKVLDLGCAPGSWLLYAAQATGPGGQVTGIDLKPVTIELPGWATVLAADIFELEERLQEVIGAGYQVVLSDMAPSTTGIKDMDAYRSYNLCMAAYRVAIEVLDLGGCFVCKIFQGHEFKSFMELVKNSFTSCRVFKPESCRKASREIYIIGIGKK